ncbi:FtsK/SpoIIIE domain-containing protein [Intestinimonas massiliensis]|uniref:FtsK/SpoIIIE domain-containing protein n=1 Tax=Intestinimonas massiliensis (ex Afouda et al. 2020) TaxID=1673721 RepID=UPI00210E9B20|nr:FtsK/SpoIIIE domain-containing protein [Intestinimonas massiliensis (ex Afouda et al. 2020)]MCQ4807989.1 FtsK/SpoIIIE domain-containing protein [Intestinimonas massiliensis (ex Afouda et al. 2020)]
MTRTDKDSINKRTENRHLLRRIKAGFAAARATPYKGLLLGLYLAGAVLTWLLRAHLFSLDTYGLFSPVLEAVINLLIPLYAVSGFLALLVLMGTPWGGKAAKEGLQKAGLVNHAGEAPVLIAKQQDTGSPRLTIWEFDPCGIPLGEWEDKRARVETALNITIAKMAWGEGRKIIRVYAVPAESDFPALLRWTDEYLSLDNFVLVLGESLTGSVTVNLAHIPHILLGGSTGSGKSVLLKLLLMQSLHKGAEVYIADFKGGVDFPKIWHTKCRMCFTEDDLLYTLNQLVAVLESRKRQLSEIGCPNLDAYNEATGESLPRLIFACDEVAEVLDRTGRSKEDKERLGQIENKLSTIARLGRAFGIHLILSTQRPDAAVIPGQIKNNLDFRVCGRADSILSGIILDNTSAAEQIPKDARGRFITGDGTVFQGYLLDERQL